MNDRHGLSIRAKVIATCVGLALTTGFAGGLGPTRSVASSPTRRWW